MIFRQRETSKNCTFISFHLCSVYKS